MDDRPIPAIVHVCGGFLDRDSDEASHEFTCGIGGDWWCCACCFPACIITRRQDYCHPVVEVITVWAIVTKDMVTSDVNIKFVIFKPCVLQEIHI